MKKILVLCLCLFAFALGFAQPAELVCFVKGYPDVQFQTTYDSALNDWKIRVTSHGKTTELYWCDGKLLPKSELANAANYRAILDVYPETIPDPAAMSAEKIAALKEFGLSENRKTEPILPPFFFDAVYDMATETRAEIHAVSMRFLGRSIRVSEYAKPIFEAVDAELSALAKTDATVANFMSSLSSVSCYNWRAVSGTGSKSFHALGIAVDIQPKSYGNKAVFWQWTRVYYPDTWMTMPLSKRWMPPQKVIDVFESHGFVWGGKWEIWDNMHFEYRPELFEYRKVES